MHIFLLSVGTSDASKEVEATTKGRPPEAPPSFQFVTTNSTQATLYLTQWESGGCPITHFLIQYRRAGISVWTTVGSEILPSRTYAVPGLASGVKYDLRVKAYNAAGTTHADYHIRTPSSDIGYGAKTISDDSWSVTHSGNGGAFAPFLWRDPRIIVPLVISFSAFVLIFVTICICIRKRPQNNNLKKDHPDQSPCRITKDLMDNQHTYSPIRRLVTSTPKAPPPSEARDSTGDYSEEDTYQYASATYQIRKSNTSPPPPTPPSPPNAHDTDAILAHTQKQRHQHPKGFSAIVYQPPSLHDVDAPNVGNCRSGDSDTYPGGDLSETDDYGSIADGEGNKQRPPRGHRNRNQKSS
ncbi:Down syndrome cell adhesion molecule-like protein Dscam2, partial [Armadillidium vulgare]